jgi:hypothetical protein
MAAKAMVAIGFKSGEIALRALGDFDRDRSLDRFNPERVDLGREVAQLPAQVARGPRDGPQHG